MMSNSQYNRLRWQCRRGMLELDLLLEDFLIHRYEQLDERLRNDFTGLLELPDQTLQLWLLGAADAAEVAQPFREIVRLIRFGEGDHGLQN